MKALIIGAAGFVGKHLISHLRRYCQWEVAATKLPAETISAQDVPFFDLDVLDPDSVFALLEKQRPDVIFHLAAQSSVALSWKKPSLTMQINVTGSIHVLESVRKLSYLPRILLVGSGEEYGFFLPQELPLTETNLLRPGNPYAISKVTQNMTGNIYVKAYGMDIVMTRAFNHIGPGQSPQFVVSDFCKQIIDIEKGKTNPILHVGNLSAKRDFTDVRDVVRAYTDLVQYGKSGETYNIGSGSSVTIQELLNEILRLSPARVKIVHDSERIRPIDLPNVEVNVDKLRRDTGWRNIYPLHQSLEDTLEYWRGSE